MPVTPPRRAKKFLFLAVLMLAPMLAGQAMAVLPDEVLKDPVLEARARLLSQDLRCLVCQNQSIDDSAAPLARDLRIIVRERLTKGDTNEQVVDYLVARYGNYVLLRPPFQADTLLLWIGPGIIFLLTAGVAIFYFRKQQGAGDTPAPSLDESEQLELNEYVKDI
jgi:cytochrome c-type biogenesis protein CcmH